MWLKRDDFKAINCCFLPVTGIKDSVKRFAVFKVRLTGRFSFSL